MGVAGLWSLLQPAAKTRSLTELAVTEGFEANPGGARGFRIGIDTSIWFFHADYGKEGENPELRTLFFRCATLMHAPFLPLFVFDGPKRPDVKRGKKVSKLTHKLTTGTKAIIEAFGFEWRTAPGEAEAELAYLNRIGVIDGILSDDVDNFLFGATTVIRNPSNNLSGNRSNPVLNSAGKDDKNHTRVYRLSDITQHPEISLTRGGMILIGLLSGGDYDPDGLPNCGKKTALGLARCGFGDTLFQAAINLPREQLPVFLNNWRTEVRHELRTNSQGHIGRKQPSLANSFPNTFPDIDVLLLYTNPTTSESLGRSHNNLQLTWTKEPDLGKLAATCEFYFEWGYKDAIIKRFRTVIWHSAVLRILRRGVLENEKKDQFRVGPPTTPRKYGVEPAGTPSKMIAKHFASLDLNSLDYDTEDDDDQEPLLIKIHSTRSHTSTDGILEYRLEIAPAQLVRLTESGIQGIRRPEDVDEWADEEEDEDEPGKRGKKPPPDPKSHLRVWMPASMVKMVEPRLVADYEEVEERKREKKAKRGQGKKAAGKRNPKTAPISEEESSGSDVLPKVKPSRKVDGKKTTLKTAKAKPRQCSDLELSDSDTLPPPARPIVKDLTKGKIRDQTNGGGLESFFPVAKPSNTVNPKLRNLSIPFESVVADRPTLSAPTSGLKAKITVKHQLPMPEEDKASSPVPGPSRSTNSLLKPSQQFSVVSDDEELLPGPRPIMQRSTRHPNSEDEDAGSRAKASVNSLRSTPERLQPKPSPVSPMLFHDDDPFKYRSESPAPTVHRTKPVRKKSSTSSGSDSFTKRLNKSPRKSSEHSSPRARYDRRTCRPESPSLSRTTLRIAKSLPISEPLPVIEISSDSDVPRAPITKVKDIRPLLLAKARARTQPEPLVRSSIKAHGLPNTKSVLQPKYTLNVRDNDIIDLS